jgi:quercetin dioxygenase-like cupin family protein
VAGGVRSHVGEKEDLMPIVDHRTVPEIDMRPGIRGRFLANKELGARGVSLLTNTVEPGAAAPLHRHTVEETMLVLEGTVWVRVGEEQHTVGPGYTVIIPAGTPHAWGNPGPGVAKLLWAFGGPDPFGDATYLQGEPPLTSRRSSPETLNGMQS